MWAMEWVSVSSGRSNALWKRSADPSNHLPAFIQPTPRHATIHTHHTGAAAAPSAAAVAAGSAAAAAGRATRLFSLLDLGGDGGEVDENSDFYNPDGIKEGA